MSGTPRISVLMSVQDGERFLPEALASIRAQTLTDFELVAVNDGSSDSTPNLLSEAASVDPRIHVLTNKSNLGLSRSLNAGLASCSAELVARMDADDAMMPRRLEEQAAFMEANPGTVAAGCWYDLVDEAGRTIRTFRPPTDAGKIREAFLWSAPIIHPGAIMRRSVVSGIGGYNADDFPFAQDRDLFLRLARVGCLGNVPQVLMKFRRISRSITVTRENEQKRCAMLAVSRAISAGDFPAWRRIHLVRPWLAIHMPSPLRGLKNAVARFAGLRHTGGS